MASSQTQTQFGTGNVSASTITVDVTGGVQYPNEIAGYEKVEGGFTPIVFAAPISHRRIGELVIDQRVQIGIFSPVGEGYYMATIQVGDRKFDEHADTAIIAKGETEIEAAREAAEWMKAHPAPASPDAAFRPQFGDTPDRPPVARRRMDNHADRIREGSTVEIDALPAVEVVEEVEPSQLAVSSTVEGVWEAELPDGSTIMLCVEKPGYKEIVSYAESLTEYAGRTAARHVTVDNENNLRGSVDTELYGWLQSKQGETVINRTGEHTFEVVEVEHLRDGFLNPTANDGLDPDSRRRSGPYIDEEESGEWFANTVDLAPGSYSVRDIGVVESLDTYAANVIVPAAEWDDSVPFAPTSTAEETDADLSNVRAADREGLSRDDTVGDITGVGDKTVDEFWVQDISELYFMGFPAPYIPAQYTEKAIADLYNLPTVPRWSDAARAVVGILGGVGYDSNGEEVGTAASMISQSVDPEVMELGWIGDKRLKDEYTPTWISNDDGPAAAGAGRVSDADIEAAFRGHGETPGNREPVTAIRHNPTNDDVVGLTTDSGRYVEVSKKTLRTMATIANVDLDEIEADDTHLIVWPSGDEPGEGVVLLNTTSSPINAVVDTKGYINPKAVAEA